jgi:hypothetical protein
MIKTKALDEIDYQSTSSKSFAVKEYAGYSSAITRAT